MAFEKIIISTLLPAWPLLVDEDMNLVTDDVTNYVKASISIAPFHVRVGVYLLSIIIGPVIFVRCWGGRNKASDKYHAAKIYLFLQGFPGPVGAVVRLYRSLGLLAFYEHPIVAPLLNAEQQHEG